MPELRSQDMTHFSDPIAPLRLALRAHYEIERQIGQGAFATVYLARDLKHERKVAIKVLNSDPTSETGELRFIREIRTVAKLQHPNILPLHDSGHVEALLYYVMPYVTGETLRDKISRERQLSCDAACSIARDVADALGYAHAQGIIHRDIKPENILLSAGHPMLADFGIARVIDLAGVRQLTRTGMNSPGTPAYMSPEQLLGDREIDGRSDTYSLGCVLYEMLAGKPPFGGKEGFVKRFTEAPPSVRAARQGLPEWVDGVLAKVLARDPNDRYPTAQEFVAALCNTDRVLPTPIAAEGSPAFEPAHRTMFLKGFRPSRRTVAFAGTAVLLITAALAAALKPSSLRRVLGGAPELDTARYAILPLAAAGNETGGIGQQAADGLYDAFTQWSGVPLVPDTKVTQALAKRGGHLSSESQALSLARELGAGKLVWGQATGKEGAIRVRVHLYDAASSESKDEFLFVDSAVDTRPYESAAMRLLKVPHRPRAADGGDRLTRSYSAWVAYGRGHVALAKWDLPNAEREFRDAVRSDPAFSPAQLWLGQLLAWRAPGRREEWRDAAARASNDFNGLDPRDRLIAAGLTALANRREPEACRAYSELIKRDSADFVGWYGLGECQSLDSTVVPATASPSRWSFRSSYRAAARAYIRALEIEPGAHAIFGFRKLTALLPTASTKVRVGKSVPPNSQTFAAFPSLAGSDTLGFVPYPMAAFAVLPPQAMRTRNVALDQNADQLLRVATNWTRRSPTDPAGFEALAEVLEIGGDIGGQPFQETAVVQALRRTRALSRDPDQLTRTVSREIWLRFKREEFAEARRLADSLIAAIPQPSESDARLLIPIAALTGKLDLAARLGRLEQPFLPLVAASMPTQVREAAVDLFVSAASGLCGTRISLLEKRLDDQLMRYVPAERAKGLRDDLFTRPLSMTAPCNGGKSALRITNPRDRLSQLQQALARGQLPLVRALLDSVARIERLGRPGDMSLDHTFQEAWLRSAIGDTAGSARMLDNTLGALPALSADNLGELAAAAAVGRAMALRARLAGASGDSKTARHWAQALATLWATADATLQSSVGDVLSLARVSGKR
ncbi:MAG: serine/threonine protein kinase [Gemmatimonadota bacterium]|nr:serine/threonine protein kinase [Gemmatimonadota bacterium]